MVVPHRDQWMLWKVKYRYDIMEFPTSKEEERQSFKISKIKIPENQNKKEKVFEKK